MALDPAIALQAGQGVTPLQDPIQRASQFAQLQNMQQQNQLGGIQVQQGQLALQDQQKMRQIMSDPSIDFTKPDALDQVAAKGAAAGISPQTLLNLRNSQMEFQKNFYAMSKDKQALGLQRRDDMRGELTALVQDPSYDPSNPAYQAKYSGILGKYQDVEAAGKLPQQAVPAAQLQPSINGLAAGSALMKEATERTAANARATAANFKVVNGTLMDLSSGTPKPAMPATATDPNQWNSLVDNVIPTGKGNDALNVRTHNLVNFYLQQGNIEGAQKVVSEAGSQLGTIEKETNPSVVGSKVNVAVATEVAKAKAQMAMNPAAVGQVPPHLVPTAIADYNKASEANAEAQSAANDMQTFTNLARSGNKIAYAYSPVEGVLTLNTGRGVKRVNMSEIESYGGAGSMADKVRSFFGKATSGASIPANVLDDIDQLHTQITANAADLYSRKVSSINNSYGAKFQPMSLGSGAPGGQGTPQGYPGQQPVPPVRPQAGNQQQRQSPPMDPTTQAKVQALRAKGVSEAQIQAALAARGQQ